MADIKSFVPVVDPKKYAQEFREFLLKSNMFSLAMGVVIGAAVGKVVSSIVGDLIMPIVGVLTPEGNWRTFKVGFWRFNWTLGHFFGEVVDFVIIAGVVFLITKAFVKQAPPPPTKTCTACKEAIHPEATKCKWCTADQPASEAPKLVT
ncbi:MAG: large conductance mechanosensitive channel protein MscL [Planctomycetaceae bacterium]|nr:large conductance mechanosensitive channel protein MscL [Planctomycetaceae bacterium]